VAVQIGAHSITEHAFAHNLWVQTAIANQYNSTRPLPTALLPKPPAYKECIAYLAKLEKAKGAQPVPDTAQLKDLCERVYVALRAAALNRLIIHYWVMEEAARAHVAVTAREVSQLLHQEFPTAAQLRLYLTGARLGEADERTLLADKLRHDKWLRATAPAYKKLVRNAPETEQEVGEIEHEDAQLTTEMRSRWLPKTRCSTGYVVVLCSEYKQ
jgi:hypothetical protein